jgi:short-subunit dehydrogenase
MGRWLSIVFAGRPAWMNALMVFSAYMAFVYVPWDFFMKPMALDEEVWFGVIFRGAAAKWTEPLHWAIYAAGAYGFYHMRSWMFPWAAVYVAQIAISMVVWPWLYRGGFGGFVFGVVGFGAFAGLTRMLWKAEPLFTNPVETLRERYGDWALVTGASAGIGSAFARALARDGISLVLTARRGDRLATLAQELEKAYQVQTRVVALDLSQPDAADTLAEAVDDLPIAILVNNAGFGYAGRFDKLDPDRLRDMLNLNCLAPMLLTRRLLPGMQERGRGAVVFTGSIAGRQPLPLHSVYAATKAFDNLLGEALFVELREQGIDVGVIEPGSTETEFQSAAGEIEHAGEAPEDVVALALDTLGRRGTVISGWFNWLRANAAARLLPRQAISAIAHDVVEKQTPPEMR